MARERLTWEDALRMMNQALLLCRGRDAEEGVRWSLFGLPGNVYFTTEVATRGPAVPRIVPCSHEAAVALYDDATDRYAPTLDVDRAVENFWQGLFGAPPTDEA